MRISNERFILRALILLGVLIGACQGAAAQSADAAMERIHDRYDAMTSMRAAFSQVTSSTYLDEPEHYSGKILLSGDRYRIEMDQQTIVTNTVLTWVYNRSENQVLINNYEEDPTTFSLSTFLAEFDSEYHVENYRRDGGVDEISLRPVDPLSSFREVRLRADNGIVRHLRITDVNDVTMEIDLSDIVFNPEITDDSFIFSIPEGTEVIDLRDE